MNAISKSEMIINSLHPLHQPSYQQNPVCFNRFEATNYWCPPTVTSPGVLETTVFPTDSRVTLPSTNPTIVAYNLRISTHFN